MQLRSRRLALGSPVVMGVVNLTPDSFSDGGSHASAEDALARALGMVDAGAAIVDLGAESTRPGAAAVDPEVQLERIMPVLERLRAASDVVVSVDSGSPEVIRAVAAAGADMINDVYALRQPGALDAVAESDLGVCLMHMQGTPSDMQEDPQYAALPGDVVRWLQRRIDACTAAGIGADRIAVDPGFGFGKTDEHNLAILSRLDEFAALERPLIVGLSRKSTLGRLTGRAVSERLPAGIAAHVMAVERGASIVRTHDVPETVDALRIVQAVLGQD